MPLRRSLYALALLILQSWVRRRFVLDVSSSIPHLSRSLSADKYEKAHMLITVPQHLYAAVILTHLSEGTVKLAVVLLYKRIFSTPGFRRAANILIVIIVGWIFAATFVSLTPNPHRLHLTPTDTGLLVLASKQLVQHSRPPRSQLRRIHHSFCRA